MATQFADTLPAPLSEAAALTPNESPPTELDSMGAPLELSRRARRRKLFGLNRAP